MATNSTLYDYRDFQCPDNGRCGLVHDGCPSYQLFVVKHNRLFRRIAKQFLLEQILDILIGQRQLPAGIRFVPDSFFVLVRFAIHLPVGYGRNFKME